MMPVRVLGSSLNWNGNILNLQFGYKKVNQKLKHDENQKVKLV